MSDLKETIAEMSRYTGKSEKDIKRCLRDTAKKLGISTEKEGLATISGMCLNFCKASSKHTQETSSGKVVAVEILEKTISSMDFYASFIVLKGNTEKLLTKQISKLSKRGDTLKERIEKLEFDSTTLVSVVGDCDDDTSCGDDDDATCNDDNLVYDKIAFAYIKALGVDLKNTVTICSTPDYEENEEDKLRDDRYLDMNWQGKPEYVYPTKSMESAIIVSRYLSAWGFIDKDYYPTKVEKIECKGKIEGTTMNADVLIVDFRPL